MDPSPPAAVQQASYIPQRLLVSGLTRPEWEVLRLCLTQAILDPNCTIGLEGPAKHGPAFEYWLDNLIDVGGIGEMFWGYGQRHINIAEDRVIIRGVLRLQVMEMAGALRQTEARREAEDVQRMIIHNQHEILSSSLSAGRKRALEEWMHRQQTHEQQRGMPGNPCYQPYAVPAPPMGPAVTSQHRAVFQPPPPPAPLLPPPPPEASMQAPQHAGSPQLQPQPPENSIPFPPRPAPGQIIFDTCLSTAPTKYRFIFSSDTPTLPLFLSRAHAKWGLARDQVIKGLMVNIDGMIFELDLDDERDWDAFLTLAGRSVSPVAVLIGI